MNNQKIASELVDMAERIAVSGERTMKAPEYKKLCREIHKKYGKALGMPFQESCDVASSVLFGETTKKRLFELLDDAVADEG